MKKAYQKAWFFVLPVLLLGGVQRADTDDDGGELFGAGNLWEQRVFLAGLGLVRTSCCALIVSTPPWDGSLCSRG